MPEKNSILNDAAIWFNVIVGLGAGYVALFIRSMAQQFKNIVSRFTDRDDETDRQIEHLRNDIIDLYNMDRQQGSELAGVQVKLMQFAERLDNLLDEHRRIHK